MSTLAYAFVTTRRDQSKADEPTGINRFVDAMAAERSGPQQEDPPERAVRPAAAGAERAA